MTGGKIKKTKGCNHQEDRGNKKFGCLHEMDDVFSFGLPNIMPRTSNIFLVKGLLGRNEPRVDVSTARARVYR